MNDRARPLYYFGTASGGRTLDASREGMGNPFASALIELLQGRTLTLENLSSELQRLTVEKSGGFQQPEVPAVHTTETGFKLLPKKDRRYNALVMVYSDYSLGGATSLPGALYDAVRVSKALIEAGFDVQTVVDPTASVFSATLAEFYPRTGNADVAMLYSTGHGVEVAGVVYLLPGDYPVEQGDSVLQKAFPIHQYATALAARSLNLILFATGS
jgi:hypothetical protein